MITELQVGKFPAGSMIYVGFGKIVTYFSGPGGVPPVVAPTDETNARLTVSGISIGGTKIVYGGAGGIM